MTNSMPHLEITCSPTKPIPQHCQRINESYRLRCRPANVSKCLPYTMAIESLDVMSRPHPPCEIPPPSTIYAYVYQSKHKFNFNKHSPFRISKILSATSSNFGAEATVSRVMPLNLFGPTTEMSLGLIRVQ